LYLLLLKCDKVCKSIITLVVIFLLLNVIISGLKGGVPGRTDGIAKTY
jgi:hypothetical protein